MKVHAVFDCCAAELARLLKLAQFFNPAPLGKQRTRDIDDDHYLAAAMGARAAAIVTNDRDLLARGKPFGVSILTPIQFLEMACSDAG